MAVYPTGSPIHDALRKALADTFVFYYKAHTAHWNVVGPDFPQYHEFLNELYDELWAAVDPIAEHIRAAGGTATASLAAILADSDIREFVNVPDAKAIFVELVFANERTIAALDDAFKVAAAANDQGLCNFLAERLDVHAKHGWMLRSIAG